jgi:hypothetical protein
VVVDDAIRPLAGANVTVSSPGGAANATATGPDGLFSFHGLKPGAWVLEVSKPFYATQRSTVDVRAGPAEATAQFQLAPELGTLPFSAQTKWDGFIECSAAVGNWCGIANLYPCIVEQQLGQPCTKVSNDQSFVFLQGFFLDQQRPPTWLQMEAGWESTQGLSSSLGIRYAATNQSEWDQFGYGPVMANVLGPSPLVAWVPNEAGDTDVGYMANRTTMLDSGLGTTRGLTTELFHGAPDAAPHDLDGVCAPDTPVGQACWSNGFIGAAVSQRISIAYIAFYGYTPPPGWRLVDTGQVPPPPA